MVNEQWGNGAMGQWGNLKILEVKGEK